MLKTLVFAALVVVLAVPVFASDEEDSGPKDADFSQAQYCHQAEEVVSHYEGAQQQMTQAGYEAAEICAREFAKDKSLNRLYAQLGKKCDKAWAKQDGSLYRTVNAHCHLKAAAYVANLANEE